MYKVDDYRPDEIEFTVESNQVPKVLGEFESDEDARVFMAQNLLSLQTNLNAKRFMDHREIEGLRDEYGNELENELPKLKENHLKKANEAEEAKKLEKEAKEMVNASRNKIEQLAIEVNDRTTDIELDSENTWQVVYNSKLYYYTFIDGKIQLAHVQDIPSYQENDLISSSQKNEKFFENLNKQEKAVNE
ncbi:hypothetical protein [Aquimarina intermedia]|uniref:Uncharacterized protein n=1 Tax=Aquimarina intermedia TaxID=350814 RepID=A0A5S5C0M4_9FLAO|nr:hypothetical protein [Aquimarina intermedia]TYP71513.1 hypothetical protein BD809_10995 [Aquimarina intermedia]